MKIVITITSAEISALIQQHLIKKGMEVNVEDIKYSKGQAVVTADAPMDTEPVAPEPQVLTSSGTVSASQYADPTRELTPPPASPPLRSIEGGAEPADMSAVFAASHKIAATTEGKFPPKQNTMLEGESYEWPGEK
jgi:hypothetical protein